MDIACLFFCKKLLYWNKIPENCPDDTPKPNMAVAQFVILNACEES